MRQTQKKKFKQFFETNENLNKVENAIFMIVVFLFVLHFILSLLFPKFINIFCLVVGCMVICSLLLTKKIEAQKDKNRRKSGEIIESNHTHDVLLGIVLNMVVSLYFAVILTLVLAQDAYISKWNLCSINIGLYSFIFVVYTFILPSFKKEIKNIEEKFEISSKNNETKNKNLECLKSQIFYFKKKFNTLTTNIIINGVLFVISIIFTLFASNLYAGIAIITSIIFCCINVINLLYELKRLFNFNLK